jgi:lipoprotein-anchoring transpeptidase ErfK/SrfK
MSTRNTLIFASLWTLAAGIVGGTGLLIWQDSQASAEIDPESVIRYGYRGAPEDQPLIAEAPPPMPPEAEPKTALLAPPEPIVIAPPPPVVQAAPPAAVAVAPIEPSRNIPPAPPAPRLDPVPVHLIPEPGAPPPLPPMFPKSAPLPQAVPIPIVTAPPPAPPAPQSQAFPQSEAPVIAAPAMAPGVIVISASERKLRYFPADGSQAVTYPVAVGRERSLIPFGVSEVVRKRRNPTWRPTPTMRKGDPKLPVSVPPGPHNPLGAFALDLGWTYYAIHGTNDPRSIGRAASSGCFRMHPDHIAALFAVVPVGTKVEVIDAPLPTSVPLHSGQPAA